jgi:hypothetical protein
LIFKAFFFCSIDLGPAHRQTSKFMHPNTPPSESITELERSLLADDLALVPRLAMSRIGKGAHDGLPSS